MLVARYEFGSFVKRAVESNFSCAGELSVCCFAVGFSSFLETDFLRTIVTGFLVLNCGNPNKQVTDKSAN